MQVVLHGADESLRSLLSDVLGDMGLSLCSRGSEARPDVVLALVQRGDSVSRVLQVAGKESGLAPVVVLLPFDDERLRRSALNMGARGCYALGTPLEGLKRLLRDVVGWPPPSRSRGSMSEAPGLEGVRGRHEDGT